ncbi:PIG-L deacetylase family protein [Anabaena sp. UHCC 0451]|uniref:PIG-L deacetylase family protein n=1 Tax=Anabaena sp. UHCC 0451 TaxID=2055235 RepID=UPI002B1EB311|nr:PIG-L deacetylase family protein [Anabaena sp. UHCC 0451]MEA5579055.1 PIG-L deacetylase family protein [Anabaena sp. UHCC 0451]
MPKQILVISAHPDDEILGLGGTIARYIHQGEKVVIAFVADSGKARYEDETISLVKSCTIEAASNVGIAKTDIRFAGLADQILDTLPIIKITQWIEEVVQEIKPQIIYTHHRGDINRDHQIVHEATLTAARPYSTSFVERILCYETPSATEWAGPYVENYFVPNVFVDISSHLENKLSAMSAYKTELRPFPHPRSLEALRTRAAYWGSIIGVTAAEPFMLVREIQR